MLHRALRARPLRCLSLTSPRTPSLPQFHLNSRQYATNSPLYDQTLRSLKISSNTRVIFQGFTGLSHLYPYKPRHFLTQRI